jgi:hypothetical protein
MLDGLRFANKLPINAARTLLLGTRSAGGAWPGASFKDSLIARRSENDSFSLKDRCGTARELFQLKV